MKLSKALCGMLAVGAVAGIWLGVAGCGIVFAPISYAKARASNADYVFKGVVVDPSGKVVQGVVAEKSSERRLWDATEGTASHHKEDYTRVDGDFLFAVRGSSLKVTFTKNGYRDAVFNFSADASKEVDTNMGDWKNSPDFSVLMIPVNARDAYLVQNTVSISYEKYPLADMISLPNLITEGATGDIVYRDKDSADPTVIPDGVLYAAIDNAPPQAIDQFGKIDSAELDIPNAVTLRIAGPGAGFVRMVPRAGLHPMLVSTLAPETGYVEELTFSRERLKEMRTSSKEMIAEAHEYFYFKVGDRYGKGVFSWKNARGKPQFTYELYVQRRAATRDLTTFSYKE